MKQVFERGEMWLGDCLDLMADIPDGSVDMVVTSPPYDDMRTYNGSLVDWNFAQFSKIADSLTRLLKPGGAIVWNVGDATFEGSESGSSFRQALYFKDACGLNIADTMIWEKTGSGALGSNRLYAQNFEYMFVLSKGRHATFNPIRDRKNVIPSGTVNTNGSLVEGKGKTRAIERQEYGKRTNIWRISQQQRSDHPAPYPESLAADHIVSWSNLGELVLDPFGGSGTTAVAAHKADRRFLSIERDTEYYFQSLDRVASL